jgi:hypothetical protein
MENLIVKLMLLATLAQLGVSVSHSLQPHPLSAQRTLEQRSKDILRISWRPISAFPEEAKRFR